MSINVAKAMDWIGENLSYFDPFQEDEPLEIRGVKKFSELALMLYVYVELTGDRSSRRVQEIIALLQAVRARREFQDWLLRSPQKFVLYCDVYVILRLLGHEDENQRELVQRVIDAGYLDQMERAPFRTMELSLTLELGEFRHSVPGLETLIESSILAQPPNPLFLNRDAAYALTHVILFYYAFGTYREAPTPFSDLRGLRDCLSALIVSYCQERYWDLLGELLMCWDCIGLGTSAVTELAWGAFARAQEVDGALPRRAEENEDDLEEGNIEEGNEEEQATIEQQRKDDFARCYHTTLVGIVASLVHTTSAQRSAPPAVQHAPPAEAQTLPRPDRRFAPAARKSLGWLEDLLSTAKDSQTTQPAVFCSSLVVAWIADDDADGTPLSFPTVARLVWQELRQREGQAAMDFSQIAPALKLVTAGLLSSQGFTVPSLHDFLREAAGALRANPSADALSDLYFCEKRVILHALGLHPAPQTLNASDVVDFAASIDLPASTDKIDELLLRIFSFTAHGTRPVSLAAEDLWLQDLLSGLAIHFLRQYDLVMGCKVLRAMCYLGLGASPDFSACIDFLHLHQRPEGSFGFFGVEEAEMRTTMPPTFWAEADLYLPVSLNCLWTLKEASDRWRLYDSLPMPILC